MKLQRYLTGLIWLCVIPVLALAVGLGYLQFRDARDDDANEAQRLAASLAQDIDQQLRSRIAGLAVLAASPLVQDKTRWRELHGQMQGFRAGFPDEVAIVDADQVLLHTGVPFDAPLPPLPRPTGRNAAHLALETAQPAIGDPFNGPVADERLVRVVVPALPGGRAAVAFTSLLQVKQLEPMFAGLALPAGWIAAAYDSRGQVIAQFGGTADQAAATGADQTLRFKTTLAAAPWTVEVRVPQSGYLQRLMNVASLIGLALLGVTLISVLAGQWAARRLARSVRALAELKPTPPAASEIDEIRDARRVLDDSLAQREAAAQALGIREQQLRGIFESANEAILTADESQTVVMANPAAAHIFGRPTAQLVGLPLAELMPERFRQRHAGDVEHFGRSESGPRPMGRRPDVVGLRADGREFPLEAAISQVHAGGQRLYTVILRDLSERTRLLRELEASQRDLQSLVRAQHTVEEKLRKRIARELHDELQQVLAAIKMDVCSIEAELGADPSRLPPLLARIDDLASAAITSSRRIVNDLRPLLLEDVGLTAALEVLCRQFSERTGIEAALHCEEGTQCAGPELAEEVSVCLYRVAQEALNNVAKHSGARHVALHLSRHDDGGVSLRVQDDGRGMAPDVQRKSPSHGLRGMGERVRALSGTLHIDSRPGEGVTLTVEIGPAAQPAPTTY